MAGLAEPIEVAGRRAPSRVVFGPHVTNLGHDRSIAERHLAYYRARAEGGSGIVVTETASVHPSDWPYERAPLAEACATGWAAVAEACRPSGTLVVAGLGHRGAQGSSAYSQAALWGPSAVADVLNREVPMVMEEPEITALVDAFGRATAQAVESGLDGVEVDAGPVSLLRQFHSGLTNLRDDAYGADRLLLTRRVLAVVRRALGQGRLLALRLCCDELAPWAGITPEQAAAHVSELADAVDLLVVVRGGPFSRSAYRPDAHTPPSFNRHLCRAMREAAGGRVAVVLQGSVVDPADAERALEEGVADAVEMTRAQIADPRLVARVRQGHAGRVRPCILCNQTCQVDDVRNPLVTCVGEPRSGHETEDEDVDGVHGRDAAGVEALVVGAGVAGLECARVLAGRGAAVRVVERSEGAGGMLRRVAAGPGLERLSLLAEWLVRECEEAGVLLERGRTATAETCDAAEAAGAVVVLATGSRPSPRPFGHDGSGPVVPADELLASGAVPGAGGTVVVHDPVGGPTGVAVAERLAAAGAAVELVTPDPVAGTLLARTGDLAEANVRLERAGVRRRVFARLREVRGGVAVVEDVWTGARLEVACGAVVDCGPRLPDEELARSRPHLPRAGDVVAPRSVHEAVLEGRRRALEALAGPGPEPAAALEAVG